MSRDGLCDTKMIPLIVMFGGVGRLPMAPGTWGSAAAIPIGYALHILGGFPLVAAVTLLFFFLGLWAVDTYLEGRQDDPSEVVIDEVVGMLLTLWPLSWVLWTAGVASHVFPWSGWVTGMVLFRFFDILKPLPVCWFHRPGALFVMLDDIVAGIVSAALISIATIIVYG